MRRHCRQPGSLCVCSCRSGVHAAAARRVCAALCQATPAPTTRACMQCRNWQGKLSEDGKSVELEIEIEAQEGDRKESRELEYSVPL